MRALRNDYVLDDYKLIVCNDFISEQQNAKILLNPKYLLNPYPLKCGARPLTVLSLLVDYKFWQESPFGYHLTNILLHAMSSAAVFLLVLLLLNHSGGRPEEGSFPVNGRFAAAVFAALVFAFHPIQAEAVNIASFRADLLATFLYILSLTALIKAACGKIPANLYYYAAGFIFFVLSLFAKEMAISLVLVFFIYTIIYSGLKFRKRTMAVIVTGTAMSALFILFFWSNRFYYLLHSCIFPNIKDNLSPVSSIGAYLSTIILSFLHYLQTMLVPARLSIDYELNVTHTILKPDIFLSLALIAVVIAAFIFVKNRLFRFGLGFWFACYLPVSNIFPLINTINDRYMYLPMVGFAVALSAVIFGYLKKKIFYSVTTGALAAVLIVVCYGCLTLRRNIVFENGYSLYSDGVKIAPTNIRVRYNLGIAYMVKNDYGEAVKNFEIVSRINPLYKKADMLHLLGVCHDKLGDSKKAKFYYRWALRVNPRKETLNNYAGILMREGNPDAAAYYYKKSLELSPDASTLNNLGIYYAVNKDYGRAAGYFKQAVELEHNYLNAWANLFKIVRDSKDRTLSEDISGLLQKTFLKGKKEI